jgi:drug/metabolite transporter (DMT)-like permease
VLRFGAYGLIAALHFFCYIASLSFTSPAHSLTLVYTAPIFVALCAAVLLHEPIRRRQWAGILIAIAGVAVLANPFAGEPGHPNWWLGDLLALGSAITFGLYSVAGRYERARYSLFQYATGVYGAAALWLLPGVLLTWPAPATRVEIAPWAWIAVLALGLLPLALGHTLYTASLRRVHAAYVNVIAAQEVTGGVLLSWLLLGIAPTGNEILGGGIALVGILVILL